MQIKHVQTDITHIDTECNSSSFTSMAEFLSVLMKLNCIHAQIVPPAGALLTSPRLNFVFLNLVYLNLKGDKIMVVRESDITVSPL